MKIIEAQNLTKNFGHNKAVNSVSFELRKGEILGLLGPNGAGKSTTISMISTLIKPSSGEIRFLEIDVLENPMLLRKSLGVVPQEIALYPELTGYENLSFFGRVYGLKGSFLEERIEEVLRIVGLSDRANDRVDTYSGGMKRRINIGVALLHQPEVLIMDEPTVGIDPQSRNHILETAKELNRKGMTILYTSHYMEEVEFLCDRIYIMDQGKIVANGTKAEITMMVPELKNPSLEDVFLALTGKNLRN